MTDSIGTIKYDPENRPGISNLLTIYSVITNMNFKPTTVLGLFDSSQKHFIIPMWSLSGVEVIR